MKKLKKYISVKKMKNSMELKPLQPYLKSSTLWSYDCQSVARGVAAGLAGAVIPGFQILYAAILVIILRGNLPIALLCTLITNPFTAIPIVYFIYYVGTLIIGNGKNEFVFQPFQLDFSSFHGFWHNVTTWALQFGKAFLFGLPIVSLCLGLIGYFGTIFFWKTSHLFFKKK